MPAFAVFGLLSLIAPELPAALPVVAVVLLAVRFVLSVLVPARVARTPATMLLRVEGT